METAMEELMEKIASLDDFPVRSSKGVSIRAKRVDRRKSDRRGEGCDKSAEGVHRKKRKERSTSTNGKPPDGSGDGTDESLKQSSSKKRKLFVEDKREVLDMIETIRESNDGKLESLRKADEARRQDLERIERRQAARRDERKEKKRLTQEFVMNLAKEKEKEQLTPRASALKKNVLDVGSSARKSEKRVSFRLPASEIGDSPPPSNSSQVKSRNKKKKSRRLAHQ